MGNCVAGKCSVCGKGVLFDEQPHLNPQATFYWKSSYEKVNDYIFIVQRKTPTVNKKGKVGVITTNEYVQEVYCSVECSLKDYERTRVG